MRRRDVPFFLGLPTVRRVLEPAFRGIPGFRDGPAPVREMRAHHGSLELTSDGFEMTLTIETPSRERTAHVLAVVASTIGSDPRLVNAITSNGQGRFVGRLIRVNETHRARVLIAARDVLDRRRD